MKRFFKILLILPLIMFSPVILKAINQDLKLKILELLPCARETGGWYPEGEAEVAAGNDLFLLIDGGAAIYQEYGFKQTVHQTYHDQNGKSINLEIYEMNSPESAYGIYTFKRSEEGKPVNLGQEGWLESYYLNFWKGNFLVTIIGLDTDSITFDGIKNIARAVDSKLELTSEKPHIISCLPAENLRVNGIIYLKGNLALFNQYIFDSRDIFGLKEGVMGKYPDHSLFLFQYTEQNEANKWYEFARSNLKTSTRFTHFRDHDTQFKINDPQNDKIYIRHYHNWILIALGNPDMNGNQILNELERRILP